MWNRGTESGESFECAPGHNFAVEVLEPRRLLSLAPSLPVGIPTTAVATSGLYIPASDLSFALAGAPSRGYTQYQVLEGDANPRGSAGPTGRTPAQIRKSYGVDNIIFGAISGNGAGQTIAIVDAYDNPSFVSDTDSNFGISDLHRFDTQFGLADPPSFKKVDQWGGMAYPSYNSGWSGEIALDVEWAHAMAPQANILLVEASSSSSSDLYAAVRWAATQNGVSAISMSWGLNGEFSGETSDDGTFTSANHHVTFLASSGDNGGSSSNNYVGYPAMSANVVAVGGTSLYQADSTGTYSSESGWSGSGGGISHYVNKPAYQQLITTPSANRRTIPDVAMVADPSTGVSVLNTASTGIGTDNGWYVYGGTSLSSPLWAGLIAIANQGRAQIGLGAMDGPSQTLPRLYSLGDNDYHDITSGSNGGYSAQSGYDLVTGRGTPMANALVPDLAGGVNISGKVFRDNNGNSAFDVGEQAMNGVTVFLDLNNNGVLDSGERSTVTNASGAYSFTDLVGGVTYNVRQIMPASFIQTSAVPSVVGQFGLNSPNNDLGDFPTSFSGSAFTLRLDTGGTREQIFASSSASGSPAYTVAQSLLSALSFTGTGGADTFNLDLGNGNPLPAGGISYNGAGGADRLIVSGSSSADTVGINNSAIAVGGINLAYTNIASATFNLGGGDDTLNYSGPLGAAIVFNGGSGSDTLNVLGGSFVFNSDANLGTSSLHVSVATGGSVGFNSATQHLGGLSIAAGGSAAVTAGGGKVLVTQSLSIASGGTFDLANNNLILDYSGPSPAATIRTYLAAGFNGGAWNGAWGIVSSTASPAAGTTLGYAEAASLFSNFPAIFAGQNVDSTAVLVRYTISGDANLDGTVDVTDLGLLATNWQQSGMTFNQADFNYDGMVDVSDLGILATNWQKVLPASVASAAPAVAPLQASAALSGAAPARAPVVFSRRGARLIDEIFESGTAMFLV